MPDTCIDCEHLRVDHRRSVLWCFYLQRDLPTTEYGTQVRDDECPLREAVRLVAMRDGRYDAATDRVRLTGLEPQQ